MNYSKRKSTRIPGFDYSTHNFYFVTICTHDKKCIFGTPKTLNFLGQIAASCMEEIPAHFPGVKVEKYVVMPNHVHAILIIGEGIDQGKLPNLTAVVGGYKAAVSKLANPIMHGRPVWQRSFHDHVIRNQVDFENIWQYIEENPSKWEDDCFFQPPPKP